MLASDMLPREKVAGDVRAADRLPHKKLSTIPCPFSKGAVMADVQVTCITKPHPQSPHEHITQLGNPSAGWTWPREQVIASIEAKSNTFYVLDPRTGKRADIGVVRAAGHAPYLRTYADGVWTTICSHLTSAPYETGRAQGSGRINGEQYVKELPPWS
jgi:hypothetical protein